MSESALIAKARESKTSPTGAPCNACPSVGMPILPVRMAIVPTSVKGVSLPVGASDPLLDPADKSKVALTASSYALRTLRPGFLYLYYPEGGTTWTWHCYMISPSGSLREVPLSSPLTIAPTEPACQRGDHATNSSLISIQNPEKIQKAYVAYSEHFWTAQIRNANAKLLGTRMREFSPATWWMLQMQNHCFKPAQLTESVVEYFDPNSKPFSTPPNKTIFSLQDFAPKDFTQALADDCFEYKPRKGQAANIAARMDAIAKGKGMVLVVPDPIGCVSSLNSLRMHAVDRLKSYIQTPAIAWKHSTAIQIQGLRDYVMEQAKEQIKSPLKGGRGGVVIKTRDQRIQEQAKDGWERFEEHYSESARTQFLKEHADKCSGLQKDITALDKDYCAWLTSASYKLAKADYDRANIIVGCQATALDACVLAGGVLSEHSLKTWKEMLQRNADDLQNYAVLGILANQEKWAKGFQSADEKSLGDFLSDTGTVGKHYDVARNALESAEFGEAVKAGIKAANQHAADLLYTVVGAIGAITADATRSGANATDAALLSLERLQAKLGLTYAHLHIESQTVLIKIELTVDEWHRVATGHMRANLGGMTKQASEAFASMAMAVQLRIPPNSAAAQKLVPFMYWISGTATELSRAIKELGEAAVDASAKVVRTGAKAFENGITRVAGAGLKGAEVSTRAVTVIGHNLKAGSRLLAQIPKRISASAAAQIATKLTRNSFTIAGSTDVRFASVAICFQIYGLRTAMKDYENNVGWKQTEAAWAMGSSVMGLTGAVFDIGGKAIAAVKGSEQAAVRVLGLSTTASMVVRVGGFFGVGASVVDCVQSLMKSYTLVKRGDKDAAVWAGLGALASAGAAVAGYFVVMGGTALLGPVGWLILAIGAGLIFAYMAFMAEDTPVGIWLERCSFGNNDLSVGKFTSQKLEADALEMVGKQFVIQVEWHDTMSRDTDEIEISVRRPALASDAILMGLRLHGEEKEGDRLSAIYAHGATSDEMKGMKRPDALHLADKAKTAVGSQGVQFEAIELIASGENKVVADGGSSMYQWEKRFEVNTRKFKSGTVYIRYFPDKTNLSIFSDQELLVAD